MDVTDKGQEWFRYLHIFRFSEGNWVMNIVVCDQEIDYKRIKDPLLYIKVDNELPINIEELELIKMAYPDITASLIKALETLSDKKAGWTEGIRIAERRKYGLGVRLCYPKMGDW